MNAWPIVLAAAVAVLHAADAMALDLTSLKGQGVDASYGRYAPRGDCTRGPYVTVGDAGFAFEVGGKAVKTTTFVNVLTYAGQDYRGVSTWYFPFVVNATHPVLLTLNANENKDALTIEAYDQGYKGGPPLTPFNAALVKGSPYARCGQPAPSTSATPGGGRATNAGPSAPIAALDWTALPVLVGKYQGDFDLFGAGSAAAALKSLLGSKLAVLRGNLQVGGPLHREAGVYYLSGNAPHQGGEDQAYVLFDAARHALQVGLWERGKLKVYATPGKRIAPPADIRRMLDESPGQGAAAAPGQPWEILPVAGRPPIALATAAASTDIKSLSVFCDGGQPVLALLLNRRPAPGPLTLSLVFRGGIVNLPMSRGNNAATFWQAGLGASQLPRMLASQAGVAYLRINGAMQGEISMQNGAAASRSVLGSCHRY